MLLGGGLLLLWCSAELDLAMGTGLKGTTKPVQAEIINR